MAKAPLTDADRLSNYHLRQYKNKQKLERKKKRLESLQRKTYTGDELSKHFHLGTVGHAGRPSTRLNDRREASIERAAADAQEIKALKLEINKLLWHLAQPAPTPKPPKKVRAKTNPTERERAIYEFVYYGKLEDVAPEDWTPAEVYAVRQKYRNGMPLAA